MHSDTKKLIGIFIFLTVSAVFFWTTHPKVPGWLDAMTGGGHTAEHAAEAHGDEAHADAAGSDSEHAGATVAAATTQATTAKPEAELAAELAAEHEAHMKHLGIYQAIAIFLAISCTLFAFVTFWVMLLTVNKLDKERVQPAPAH